MEKTSRASLRLVQRAEGQAIEHNTMKQAFAAFDVQFKGKASLEDFQAGLRVLNLLESTSWTAPEASAARQHGRIS